jgi:hypothetical protein
MTQVFLHEAKSDNQILCKYKTVLSEIILLFESNEPD